jgi:hypothetical protein
MSDFERWFEDQDFYTNMRFIHGDKLFDKDGDVYRVLPVQMVYQGWNTQRQRSKDEFVALTQEWHTKGWNARQGEIEKLENELSTTKQVLGNVIDMEVAKVDNLKAQLNNMEACYIEKKKEVEELRGQIDASKSSQPKLHKTEIGDCLHFSTTMFHDGKATCFDCDAVVNHKREVIGVMQTKALRGES